MIFRFINFLSLRYGVFRKLLVTDSTNGIVLIVGRDLRECGAV